MSLERNWDESVDDSCFYIIAKKCKLNLFLHEKSFMKSLSPEFIYLEVAS